MSEAPERIWWNVAPLPYSYTSTVQFAGGVEYVRADHIEELEAKLAKWVIAEYDNGDVISLSSFAGGASEGGAWSTLTLMKEEANGDISFREYKAVKGWEITLAELTGGKDE